MEYFKYLRQYVGHQPLILPGSVVIIINEDGEILLQERYDGSYGLPGGLMDLGESLEEVAKREVFEETGLIVKDLQLVTVFSGQDFYLKVANGDELYAVTAVYYTNTVTGTLKVDEYESKAMRYFVLDQLPNACTGNDRRFVEAYMKMKKGDC